MNPNYKGSLAERFIIFRSGIRVTQSVTPKLFDTFAVFIPSTLAAANLVGVDLTTIETTPVVVAADFSDYAEKFSGGLLDQWGKLFNDGANVTATIIAVVFYVPDGSGTDTFDDYLTVTEGSIDYAPLTAAFDLVAASAYWKTMFSVSYDAVGADERYTDMALSLALLCKNTAHISYNLAFVRQTLPLETVDTNLIQLLSIDYADQVAAATALDVVISGVTNPRTQFFWGMLNRIEAANTWLVTHSEDVNILANIFQQYYANGANASNTFIGNKLSRLALTGYGVKPMGVPSILDSAINTNIARAYAEDLDLKNIGYLFSIAEGLGNTACVSYARGITGVPVAATAISKYVDYFSSQTIARMITDAATANVPVLKNERTYERVKNILISFLQAFARSGRLNNISIGFPPYAELPESATDITVTEGWEAAYVDDLDKVTVTGLVVV